MDWVDASHRPRRLLVVAAVLLLAAATALTAATDRPAGAVGGSPVVTGVTPGSGATFATTQIKITGRGFWCGASQVPRSLAVSFGASTVTLTSTIAAGGPPRISLATDSEILLTVPPAPSGQTVHVQVAGPCGASAPSNNDLFTYVDQCSTTCALIAWPWATGTAKPKVGVLNGITGGWTDFGAVVNEARLLNGLNLNTWRVESSLLPGDVTPVNKFLPLLGNQPKIEFDLGDGFEGVTAGMRPWSDDYRTWDAYLAAMSAGKDFTYGGRTASRPAGPVTYWDVWNEPTTYGFFQPEGSSNDYYQLFANTYLTLKSLGSPGKVVIPSVATFIDYHLPATGPLNNNGYISMKDLLDWIEAYNHGHPGAPLHFGGYSFHVINAGGTCYESPMSTIDGCAGYALNTPDALGDAIRRMRNLLDEYPDLKPAEIHVNEYGTGDHTHADTNNPFQPMDPGTNAMPGWQAGFIASMEDAGVDSANLSCWDVRYGLLNLFSYQQCLKGVDGLFADNNSQANLQAINDSVAPEPNYYVLKFYGAMKGAKLLTASSASNVSAYAARDDATQSIKMLVGRHDRCSVDTSRDSNCPASGPPVTVMAYAAWPYGGSRVHYTIQPIPYAGGGPMVLPPATTGVSTLSNGLLTLPIVGVQNTAAYTVEITPI